MIRARADGQVTLLAGLGSEELAHNGVRPSPALPHAFSEACASYTGLWDLYHVLLGAPRGLAGKVITGHNILKMPTGEIVPLFGSYSEGCRDRELVPMPGKYGDALLFKLARTDAAIATEINRPLAKVRLAASESRQLRGHLAQRTGLLQEVYRHAGHPGSVVVNRSISSTR